MKVHFAGHDSTNIYKPLRLAGVNYSLASFYKLKEYTTHKQKEIIGMLNSYEHSIIDSGLFTLMFGAKKDTPLDEKFIIKWQDNYADYVIRNNYKHTIVECDVQKKISPEFAWEMRKKFKKQLPDTQIINVYHLEDENPDKLIDYSDYIAVSIPELRFNVERSELMRITRYIAQKACAKKKKVHLLGCTELKMMKEFSYCYSCDSTSWISGGKFNNFHTKIHGHIDIDTIYKNVPEELKDMSKSTAGYYWQAYMKLQEYKQYAGGQQ